MRKSMLRTLLGVGITLFFSACSTNNFTDYNILGDLRVLTILVDQPEVNPGTTVNLTPVLSDLNGQGRTLNYSVFACIDPGVGIGVQPTCATPDPSSIQTGTVTPAAGASQTYTGSVASFAITVPTAATIFAGRSPADQFNGVAYLVFYTVSAPGGSPSVQSFVRVIVSATTKNPKNQNPVITSVNLNDVPISGVASAPVVATNLSVISPASSSENYSFMFPDGSLQTQTETLINTFFISDGTIDFQRTQGNSEDSWTPPSSHPAGRGVVIVTVTRDGRDGTAFQKVDFN